MKRITILILALAAMVLAGCESDRFSRDRYISSFITKNKSIYVYKSIPHTYMGDTIVGYTLISHNGSMISIGSLEGYSFPDTIK